MTLNPLKWISWLANLFRSDRAKLIRRLLPQAIEVARKIAARDWDLDGTVESAREELRGVIDRLPVAVVANLLAEYAGIANAANSLPVRVLKKVLAIALLVDRLVGDREPVPSYGILDTVLQLGYEKLQ